MKNKSICFYVVNISCILVLVFSTFFGNYNIKTNTVKEEIKITGDSDKEIEKLNNDNTLHLTNEYATHYFYNLTENFGVNEMGSCGYIALGMLLSYYDTYWDDNFIEETFDQNASLSTNSFTTNVSSPGIKVEQSLLTGITGNGFYKDGEDYLNRIVKQNSSNFFHLKLIEIGDSLGYYDKSLGRESAGLEELELLNLTGEYLYNTKGYSESQVKIESRILSSDPGTSSDYEVRLFVEEKIKQGIPVLITMSQVESQEVIKRHAMVAYDYDFDEATKTNKVYVHTGLKNSYNNAVTHIDLASTNYNVFTSAIALQPLTLHVINGLDCEVTNNYVYQNGSTTKTYCPCSNQTFYQEKLVFNNLSFFNKTVNLLISGTRLDQNSMTIDCRTPFPVFLVEPNIQYNEGEPYFVFIGWCADEELTNQIDFIPAGWRGEINLYAKWRVDYKWISYNRTLNVTKAEINDNPYDQFTICSAEDLSKITQMGITKLTIEFYISIKEIRNGTQYLYFYGGTSGTEFLGSTTFEATNEYDAYKVRFTVDISKLGGNPVVYMKYKTSKSGFLNLVKDEWQSNQYFAEISFVVNESDITGYDALDFVWHYENSLARQMN